MLKKLKFGPNRKKRIADIFEKIAVAFWGIAVVNSFIAAESNATKSLQIFVSLMLCIVFFILSYTLTEEVEVALKQTLNTNKKGKV